MYVASFYFVLFHYQAKQTQKINFCSLSNCAFILVEFNAAIFMEKQINHFHYTISICLQNLFHAEIIMKVKVKVGLHFTIRFY